MISEIQVTESGEHLLQQRMDEGILIESFGTGLLDELRELLHWNGDTNLYCGYEFFWTLQVPKSSQADLADLKYKLDEWKSYWPRRGTEAQARNVVVFDWPEAVWHSVTDGPDESSRFQSFAAGLVPNEW